MGVAGCGKTSVGEGLAALGLVEYIDGDALHPPANIEKMSQGEPLTDDDRAPWLTDVGQALAEEDGPVVIGCSALKRKYRDWIREAVPEPVRFIHLDAPQCVLEKRVAGRSNHFMPTGLLDSQFAALERLTGSEMGAEIDIAKPYADVIAQSEHYVRETLI